MEGKKEEIIYLDPVIEEEDLVDLDEDAALNDNNNTCSSSCDKP